MTMVRKQVYITKEQDKKLKLAARQQGITEAALVRLGIDRALADDGANKREEAWERLFAFMEQRARMKVPQEPRTWTRDDLYDD
jgi:hypothetical protein